jgi:hypothetical protein
MDSINKSPRDTYSPTRAANTGPAAQIAEAHSPDSVVDFLRLQQAGQKCVRNAFEYGWGFCGWRLTAREESLPPQAKQFETIKQNALRNLPESEKNEAQRFNDEVSIGLVKLMKLPAQAEQDYMHLATQNIDHEEKRQKVCAWNAAQDEAMNLTKTDMCPNGTRAALCIAWGGDKAHDPTFSYYYEKDKKAFRNDFDTLDKCGALERVSLLENAVRAHLVEQMPSDFQERYYAIVNQPDCSKEEIESQVSAFLNMPSQRDILFSPELSVPMRHAFPSDDHPDNIRPAAQDEAMNLTKTLMSHDEIRGALCISWGGAAGHHPFFFIDHEKSKKAFRDDFDTLDKCGALDPTILFDNAVRAHLVEQMPSDFQERYYAIVNQPDCSKEEIESQVSTFLNMPSQQDILFSLELSVPMRHAFPSDDHPEDNK